MHDILHTCARMKLSLWMSIAVIVLCAAQMQPGLHMLITLPIIVLCVFGLRLLAKFEGKHDI